VTIAPFGDSADGEVQSIAVFSAKEWEEELTSSRFPATVSA
jgi:hypothetical protein